MIMPRTNRAYAADCVRSSRTNAVLEISFGPGDGIALLADTTEAGHMTGVDPAREISARPPRATLRPSDAIEAQRFSDLLVKMHSAIGGFPARSDREFAGPARSSSW
jgi:hypothetical protein